MRAGKMRQVVTIQKDVGSGPNASGDFPPNWQPVVDRPAEVVTQGGRELWIAQQLRADATHLVKMRYDKTTAAITEQNQLLWGSAVLAITNVTNLENRNREIHCTCTEVKNQ